MHKKGGGRFFRKHRYRMNVSRAPAVTSYKYRRQVCEDDCKDEEDKGMDNAYGEDGISKDTGEVEAKSEQKEDG